MSIRIRRHGVVDEKPKRFCPNCSSGLRRKSTYHGSAMLAARINRNILAKVVQRMTQYKSIDDIPEHLF